MICPLRFITTGHLRSETGRILSPESVCPCVEDLCGLWSSDSEGCAVLGIADSLSVIQESLRAIENYVELRRRG